MNKWRIDKLSTLCTRIGDGLHGTPQYSENTGFYFINGNNLNGGRIIINSDTKEVSEDEYKSNFIPLNENSLLLGINGTIGNMAFYRGERIMLGKSSAYLNFTTSINKFYYYYFQLPGVQKYFYDVATGSTIKNLSLKSLQDFKVPIPNDVEFKKIVAVLSAFDDKIELNNKINAELEQMAKTLYDYWFVQFDFPNAKGKPYKSSGGKMVCNEVLRREVPEGWQHELINDLGTIVGGGTPSRSIEEYFTSNGIAWITPKDLSLNNGNKFITKGDLDITEKGFMAASLNLLPAKSVLMSSRAPIGYLAVNTVDCTTNQGFKSIVCNKTYSHEYVYYVLKNYMPTIEANATGSTFKEISAGVFKSIKIIKPKYEIVEKFIEQVKPIFDKQDNLEKQNHQLANLRDWLLPMLMNGQVKVIGNTHSHGQDLLMATRPEAALGKVVQLNIPTNRKTFAKQVLAGKIISRFKNDANFTDIKFQKIQFLAEHIVEADLNLNYYYQAAGPYDNVFMHTIYNDLKKNKWYECKDRKFAALEKQGKIEKYYQNYFGPATGQLDKLFRLLSGATEAKSEIIATIYAVWNNFIIEGKPIVEDELIQSFYNWSERKHQYTRAQVLEGLQWLREYKLEPTGFGKLIKKAKSKK
ncbi:restriction endonuclease subunit S [Chitinophaga qingshengii]|uniref:Restriction endonuclease subunit S n=1 Tax=Chitinophaga qingshengii TaxID=1569794 RepID=A0ABR7TPQ4_9BACT|nr:restriction endonuclease subunit S [Chitinophaga qingshengii]MBC9931496.1 restriction endonuclease subunit S [Chitinophaga qingshengii]